MDEQRAYSEQGGRYRSWGESGNESGRKSYLATFGVVGLCARSPLRIRKLILSLWKRTAILILLSFLTTAIIGYVNYLLGYELSTAIFYLVPVSLASWAVGKRAGFLVAVASAGAVFLSDEAARPLPIHPLIPLWKAIESLGSFLLIAWLVSARKRANEKREQLTIQLKESAVVDERNRIAREIHDTLAQGFTGIFLQLEAAQDIIGNSPKEAAKHIERARSLAQSSLGEARRSVWALRSPELDGRQLTSAIQSSIDRVATDASTEVRYSVRGTPRPLNQLIELGFLRICQEALTNALKHAKASRIHVQIVYEPVEVQLCVEDNGHGFDTREWMGTGFGLTGMHERAEQIGAELAVHSNPGLGTQVVAAVRTPASGLEGRSERA
jgi:signal transduction histidine kinase